MRSRFLDGLERRALLATFSFPKNVRIPRDFFHIALSLRVLLLLYWIGEASADSLKADFAGGAVESADLSYPSLRPAQSIAGRRL
jgi:hypothetical protein